jgi:hypothetical protein
MRRQLALIDRQKSPARGDPVGAVLHQLGAGHEESVSLGVREPRSIGSAAGQHLHHPLISTGSIRLGSLFLTLPTRGLTGQHVISPKRRARVTSQSRSFDDLVGAAKDRGWDFNPNRARGFEVDH